MSTFVAAPPCGILTLNYCNCDLAELAVCNVPTVATVFSDFREEIAAVYEFVAVLRLFSPSTATVVAFFRNEIPFFVLPVSWCFRTVLRLVVTSEVFFFFTVHLFYLTTTPFSFSSLGLMTAVEEKTY